jgi:hypothetical protein
VTVLPGLEHASTESGSVVVAEGLSLVPRR